MDTQLTKEFYVRIQENIFILNTDKTQNKLHKQLEVIGLTVVEDHAIRLWLH